MFRQINFPPYFSVLEIDTGIQRTETKDIQQIFISKMHFLVAEMSCVAFLRKAKNGKETDFLKVYLIHLFNFFLPPIPIAGQKFSLGNKNEQVTNMVQFSASNINEVTKCTS